MSESFGNITMSQFYNRETLNIFCDASIIGKNQKYIGCYGAIAVIKDDIVDSIYRMVSETTNNNCEIKGIRAALTLANRYKYYFKYINIFSDSQISVFGLRDYIYNWKYNPKNGLLYGSTGSPIVNQEIFIECHNMIIELELYRDCIIRLFHQSGHVDNGFGAIKDAAASFKKFNNVHGTVGYDFIRYISTYNNYVDNMSRSILRRSDKTKKYVDPIIFQAQGKIYKE